LAPGSSSADTAGEGGEVVVEAVPFIKLFDVTVEAETKSATRAVAATEENPIVEAVWCDTALQRCS
jgi:predicted dinucleotide-binding enzyme